MLTRLTDIWTRYRDADRRQIPLFPEWERSRWLAPLPSLGAALGLAIVFAVWTPTEVPDHTAALIEPVEEAQTEETEEPAAPEYDLAAIPDHIKTAAERYHLSEDLIRAVISVESNFDHNAVSRKGAQGLMQLMPQTSALMGVRDPHSPDENIDAGAGHLRAMLDTFKGDLRLALAAYNAGEQTVVRYHGIPPYPETRRFVARVLRRMGDRKGARAVMARPVPSPRWVSRTPHPKPRIEKASERPAPPRPLMIPVSASRAEPAAQLVLGDADPDPRPGPLTWGPVPAEPSPPPRPTRAPVRPLEQSP
jgi:Transglycosylase SLT domain